jgi:Zn-dependent peptidase ImmA (M78 family)
MISAMLGWINGHSSFNHDVTNMPDVVKVSAKQMAEVAFGGNLPLSVDPEKLRIYGLYNFNEDAVYILDSLDMESEKGKGILLHELVHFLQYQYDKDEDVKCKNELESLAYVLEAKFLAPHDHEHNINMEHVNRVSQCS